MTATSTRHDHPTTTTEARATRTHQLADAVFALRRHVDSVSRDDFVAAMRCVTSGVNVVTTDGEAGRFGLTVSAMTSLSAEPPMLLACINLNSPACAAVRDNGQFAVNVLKTSQRELADTFAGFPADGKPYDFERATWRNGRRGVPLLEDALASFDCAVEAAHEHGSHTLFVGRVVGVSARDDVPLLYGNRNYLRPIPLHD